MVGAGKRVVGADRGVVNAGKRVVGVGKEVSWCRAIRAISDITSQELNNI